MLTRAALVTGLAVALTSCGSEVDAGSEADVTAVFADSNGVSGGVSDVDTLPWTELPDVDDPDAAPASFGEACGADESCASGLCVPHHGGLACSAPCDDDDECPSADWECVAGACRSLHPALCRPCRADMDCVEDPGAARCVHLEGLGGFCGAGCAGDGDCPAGWVCAAVETIGGGGATQCLPSTGACACSEQAVAEGWGAWCPGPADGCAGARTCTRVGLGPCLSSQPSAEVCNGVDDDCDGVVDDGSCDDGEDCTLDVCNAATGCEHMPLDGVACGGLCVSEGQCVDGRCEGPAALMCDDLNPCTDDLCDPQRGCVHTDHSRPCDDGSACTAVDTCVDGACVGAGAAGCEPGEAVELGCGLCGTRTCICSDSCVAEWCGQCTGSGPCSPGEADEETVACDGCGQRTRARVCGEDCRWQAWAARGECEGEAGVCSAGAAETESEPCGACGTRARDRVCNEQCAWNDWSDWGTCGEQGVCEPGQSDAEAGACGDCGTRTRSRTCTPACAWGEPGPWSACEGEGGCAPGAVDSQTGACGSCGTRTRTRTCGAGCSWGAWGAWGSCGGQGACAPGTTAASDCDACAERTCTNGCQWSACQLKAGAQCLHEGGSNWRCCGGGGWQFCLPPIYGCVWSDACEACSGCGC